MIRITFTFLCLAIFALGCLQFGLRLMLAQEIPASADIYLVGLDIS